MNPEPNSPSGVSSFLQHLREATAAEHEALEQSPLSRRLMMPDVTLSDYTAYLLHMQPVVAFADDELLPFLQEVLPDFAERKKAHWLAEDLRELNAVSSTVPAFHPFKPSGVAYAFGFFYVIEGSVLGGRVLLKQLQKSLPVSAEKGGRFFAGYADSTSEKWKAFLAAFTGYVTEKGAEDDAIKGATDAFAAIKHHFNH